MNIKHIFFDLDHTLWDFESNSENTFKYIFDKNSIEVSYHEFSEIYKIINEKYWKLYREDKVTKSELRYSRLRDSFVELKYEIDDSLIDILSEEYILNLANYNALFVGAKEILEYLKPKYKIHIITNGFEEVQYRKLKNSFILTYFTEIISSEKAGVKKPNPKIFNYALEMSNAKPEESIMIGDNFEADILGAKKVGMHTIFCEFNGQRFPEEGLTVSKLEDLKKYL